MTPVAIYVVAMAAAGSQDKPVIVPPAPPPPPIIVPAPTPPPPGSRATPRPINPGGWISTADYPSEAIRAGAEGSVGIRLAIAANGRPTGCEVTASSGNAALDNTACMLMVRRGRFDPSLDASGKPIAGSYQTHVRWDLRGQLRPVPSEGELVITLTAAPDGSVSDCSFTAKGAPATTSPDHCKTIRFAPQADKDAKSRRVRLTTRVEYLDEE